MPTVGKSETTRLNAFPPFFVFVEKNHNFLQRFFDFVDITVLMVLKLFYNLLLFHKPYGFDAALRQSSNHAVKQKIISCQFNSSSILNTK